MTSALVSRITTLLLALMAPSASACPTPQVVYLPANSQINASTDATNKYGVEDGNVVRREDGSFFMIGAEMYADPVNIAMRLGVWASADGLVWKKQRTLRTSSADMTGNDPHSSSWGPFFTQDPTSRVWVLSYVGYRGAPNNASGWLGNFRGTIFARAAAVPGDAGLDSDFGDAGDWQALDLILLQPDDYDVAGPWPHRCQGLQGTDSMFAYPLANGFGWAALVGTSHQEIPNPYPYPGDGKWPVSHATAPALMGPWTRTNPTGVPADAPCVNMNNASTENPIVSTRPDDAASFQAVFDDIWGEASGFGYSCSATGGLDWEPAVRVPIPGGCRTPFGMIPMTHAEVIKFTPEILAYGVINATRIGAPNTTLSWFFYTVRQGAWEVFRTALVQQVW